MSAALTGSVCADQSGYDCFILCTLHNCCNAPSLPCSQHSMTGAVLTNLAMTALSFARFMTAAMLQAWQRLCWPIWLDCFILCMLLNCCTATRLCHVHSLHRQHDEPLFLSLQACGWETASATTTVHGGSTTVWVCHGHSTH